MSIMCAPADPIFFGSRAGVLNPVSLAVRAHSRSLPVTVADVDVLDPHVLRASVLALPKCLGCVAEGVYQQSRGMSE